MSEIQKKFQNIYIQIGCFDFAVRCLIGNNIKILSKYVGIKLGEDVNINSFKSARGKVFYKEGYVPILWIPKSPQTVREVATLCHECLHIIYYLFRWAGIPLSAETEEVMAHSQAYLLSRILKKIK